MNILNGKIDCKPEETGFDGSRLDVLNNHFERLIENEVIFGAEYCISHKGKVIANSSVGFGDAINMGTQLKPDTVFDIASITKTITATAIMQLVEDGLIRLDSAVGDFIPAFSKKPFTNISVLQLLTHTSGLYPDGGCFADEFPVDAWTLIDNASAYSKDFDWIETGISTGLRRKPGTEWMYCSFGFAILGEIIKVLTGQRAEDYIAEHILKPLKMMDSAFVYTKETAPRAFIKSERGLQAVKQIVDGTYVAEEVNTIWERIPNTAGGISSTAYDLIRFGNAMLNMGRLDGARILGRKAVEKMTTIQISNTPDKCWGADLANRLYGIGFDMRQGAAYTYSTGTFMHEGAGACSIDIDPKEQLIAAWFVPFNKPNNGWSPEPLYNAQNIIWSGLI